MKLAAVQRARDVATEGLRSAAAGHYADASEHLGAAEQAFRELGEVEAAEEVAKERKRVDVSLKHASHGGGEQTNNTTQGYQPEIRGSTRAPVAAALSNTSPTSWGAEERVPGMSHDTKSGAVHAEAGGGEDRDAAAAAEEMRCGVGICFECTGTSGHTITAVRAGSPAALSDMIQVGDVLLKVDNVSVYGKTQEQIIDLVVGPPNTSVALTLQQEHKMPQVVTAPFQELPFDLKKDKTRKRVNKKQVGVPPALYGGGTLPPGFEHLESLRCLHLCVCVCVCVCS